MGSRVGGGDGENEEDGEPLPCLPPLSAPFIVSALLFVGNWNYFGWGEQQSKYSA